MLDLTSLHCPLCKQHSLLKQTQVCPDYLTKHPFTLLHCPTCDCYFTQDNLTTTDHHIDYYGPTYYNSKGGKFSPWIEQIFRLNHQRNAAQFYQKFHPQSVLEIGCGRAYILRELKQLGCEVYCLESGTAADWILNNPTVNVVSPPPNQGWPFPANYFQLIIFWHVLEHLPDPVIALQQATTVLAPEAFLCLSVPNIASLQAKLGFATWFHLDVPRHLLHFSKHGLIELLKQHHYEILEVTSGDAIQNLYGWFQSLANLFTPHDTNALYRFLQGGIARSTVAKIPLLIQLLTVVIWLPLGLLGYVIEELSGNYGTVTIYAKKKSTTV